METGGVVTGSHWGRTPRQSIEAECARRGKDQVVAGCIELLLGRPTDDALVAALGGPPASLGDARVPQPYWLRVWAARGLLWAWEAAALPALTRALNDENWRVREMAAKVVARHLLGEALPVVVELRKDPVPRVRSAASRAVVRLTEAGDLHGSSVEMDRETGLPLVSVGRRVTADDLLSIQDDG